MEEEEQVQGEGRCGGSWQPLLMYRCVCAVRVCQRKEGSELVGEINDLNA